MADTVVVTSGVQQEFVVVGQERQDGKHHHPETTQDDDYCATLTYFRHISYDLIWRGATSIRFFAVAVLGSNG